MLPWLRRLLTISLVEMLRAIASLPGFGRKSPVHPHHRVSYADGIDEPVPGLLVGGPNMFQQDNEIDGVVYPSKYPDESYMDNVAAFASNEVSINWNSSAVALFSWLAAIEGEGEQ